MLHRHPLLSVTTLAYLAFVGWVTLTPSAEAPSSSALVSRVLARLQRFDELSWLTYDRAEFLANIGLFVPVGVFLMVLFGTRLWWLAIGAGIVMTLAIETAQRSIPGRVSDPRDLVANTLGTVIGVLVGLVLTAPAALRRSRARAARQRAPANA